MNRPTFDDFKKEAMADPEFKKEYEALAPYRNMLTRLGILSLKHLSAENPLKLWV